MLKRNWGPPAAKPENRTETDMDVLNWTTNLLRRKSFTKDDIYHGMLLVVRLAAVAEVTYTFSLDDKAHHIYRLLETHTRKRVLFDYGPDSVWDKYEKAWNAYHKQLIEPIEQSYQSAMKALKNLIEKWQTVKDGGRSIRSFVQTHAMPMSTIVESDATHDEKPDAITPLISSESLISSEWSQLFQWYVEHGFDILVADTESKIIEQPEPFQQNLQTVANQFANWLHMWSFDSENAALRTLLIGTLALTNGNIGKVENEAHNIARKIQLENIDRKTTDVITRKRKFGELHVNLKNETEKLKKIMHDAALSSVE